MSGITAFGGYIPRLRLSRCAMAEANAWFTAGRAKSGAQRASCNWDEDPVTMAVEAARDCLQARPRDSVRGLCFASTSAPFDDRSASVTIAQVLQLGPGLRTLDAGASQRAGTGALIAALQSAAASGGSQLVLVAERRRAAAGSAQEMSYGDGAAALLVGPGDGAAKCLAHHSEAIEFIDHYRGRGREFDYGWEERWIRDEGYMKLIAPVLKQALATARVPAASIAHFCMPCPQARVAAALARQVGLPESSVRDNLGDACGDTGAAHALVLLALALQEAKTGERILVAAFGQGCDALVFEVTDAAAAAMPAIGVKGWLARGKQDNNYSRYLAFNELVKLDHGMRAELDKQTALTTLYRKRDMLLSFIGGRCRRCGEAQFPKSRICVNPQCNALDTQDDQPFAEFQPKILSWSADYLTYCPDPPAHFGIVQFAEGGRLMADFTDVDVGGVAVGQLMRMVFRVRERDPVRGFVRYFWKAAPAVLP